MSRKSGESSRPDDQLDGFAAQARDAEERWAEIRRHVEEVTRGADEPGVVAAPRRGEQPHVLLGSGQPERAWHGSEDELSQLERTVQNFANRAEKAYRAAEEAAEMAHARWLKQLHAAEEDARGAEARRVQCVLDLLALKGAEPDAAGLAAEVREMGGAARTEGPLREGPAAPHEVLQEADEHSIDATERATPLARRAADASQRKLETHDEEKVALAKLATSVVEARRTEARRLSAQARKLRVVWEREESLRRINAARHIAHVRGDQRVPVSPSSVLEEAETRGAEVAERPGIGIETADPIAIPPDARRPSPEMVGERRAPRSSPTGGNRLKPWSIRLLTLVLLAVSVSFTVLYALRQQNGKRSSPNSIVNGSAPPATTGEPGSVVPKVTGVSVSTARDLLLQADLTLDRVMPTPGPPGIVVSAEPPSGRVLPAGTAVGLYVGVEPDRLREEFDGP